MFGWLNGVVGRVEHYGPPKSRYKLAMTMWGVAFFIRYIEIKARYVRWLLLNKIDFYLKGVRWAIVLIW